MEWFVSVSNSKARSLSIGSNCYDRQQIVKPWLAKQNNFKYFARYSQQLYMAGAASEWSTWTFVALGGISCLLTIQYKTTSSPLMVVTPRHLPNDVLLLNLVEYMRCTSIFATLKTAGSFSLCKYIQMWPLIAGEDVIFLLLWHVVPLKDLSATKPHLWLGHLCFQRTTNLKSHVWKSPMACK